MEIKDSAQLLLAYDRKGELLDYVEDLTSAYQETLSELRHTRLARSTAEQGLKEANGYLKSAEAELEVTSAELEILQNDMAYIEEHKEQVKKMLYMKGLHNIEVAGLNATIENMHLVIDKFCHKGDT